MFLHNTIQSRLVMHACNPGAAEAEAGRALMSLSSLIYTASSRPAGDTY